MRSIVLGGIFLYALDLFLLFLIRFSIFAQFLPKSQPAMVILYIVSGVGAFILLGSSISFYFGKRIAYYLAIISFTIIGLSGIINNIVIEGLTKEPAGPYGIIPDIFWFLIVPIGMIAYLVYDLEKSRKEVIK